MKRSYSLELLNLSCAHVTGRKEFIKDSRATGRRGWGRAGFVSRKPPLSRDPDKEPTGSAPRFFPRNPPPHKSPAKVGRTAVKVALGSRDLLCTRQRERTEQEKLLFCRM
ncbi:hypothetical protein CDAR_589341 [Caerostris darwini]|uniref:Ribosomal protein L2 n=1 Tax=Caerostris darwini TaxID=1538125 RepID=A0AAV4TA10_9ARAC|nr:hypothetical protein CDAR_589341 [Caerostris darwini]